MWTEVSHFLRQGQRFGALMSYFVGSERENYILRLLGSAEFSHAAAMDRLTNLPIAASEHALLTNTGFVFSDIGLQGPGEECQDVKTMRLGSFVDLESVVSVSYDQGNAILVRCDYNTR